MSEQLAKTFIEALRKLESDRDLETISSLYSENSELGNVVTHEKFHGVEGAREFGRITEIRSIKFSRSFAIKSSSTGAPPWNGRAAVRPARVENSVMKASAF